MNAGRPSAGSTSSVSTRSSGAGSTAYASTVPWLGNAKKTFSSGETSIESWQRSCSRPRSVALSVSGCQAPSVHSGR
ncbi:hypothetical protein [Cellulosimicrobium sp. CUA-896]|uniref:hypothetical protein n=1 Tax=Cellulosimicrobium sp. CUA-896 TaxID=1517881 RepID=UPI001301047F|nr:hypothetical protein [Cellulosimicrobium sp. CUA-896]